MADENVAVQLNDGGRIRLSGEEAEKVLHVINTTLRKIPDERQMFVDMSVKDVKFCFHNELVNLPANSFRKINMCKMQEANG